MNPDIFAEWFRRQDYTVVRTESSYWVDQGRRVYQAFPYHWTITPTEQELNAFLRRHNAISLRYSTPWEAPLGKASYHVVVEEGNFVLETLPRRVRQDIRKGLDYARVEPIPIARLAEDGWLLRHEVLLRQGREDAENQTWWRRMCMSAEDLPGFEAWGAVHNDQLVSTMLAVACEDCYTFLFHQSATDHLKYGINNAIFYTITHETLQRPGITQNFVALHSLDAPPSVDRFKFRMGYVARPLRQRVVFHPLLKPIINQVTHEGIRKLTKWSYNSTLAKAEGMIRFYLEGKRALDKQDIPEALVDEELPID